MLETLRTSARSAFWNGFLSFALAAAAVSAAPTFANAADFHPSTRDLLEKIAKVRDGVEEFRFLREWGKAHGVRVYVVGGTAAGLVRYARDGLEHEDLKSKNRPTIYGDERFGNDYFDIYRSTQDADVVLDAPNVSPEESERLARELEKEISERFDHTKGGKSDWEVRFLRHDRGRAGTPGHKDALISPDFLKQNTDSHSVGIVELTADAGGDRPMVRDLRAWDRPSGGEFLSDLAEGILHFYRSAEHATTRRAAAGMNPEILGAVRAYSKAFQYGATIDPASRSVLEGIVARFDPTAVLDPSVVFSLGKNAKKMLSQAEDLEVAWKELKRIGLLEKIQAFARHTNQPELARFFERIPLPSLPLGRGTGATAAALKLDLVAHATSGADAFEVIGRSRLEKPNVFMSIEGAEGQRAIHGDGFYVAKGSSGAGLTNHTLRFHLHPDAREGSDFFVIEGETIRVVNRNALILIPEKLELTPDQYFEAVAKGVRSEDAGIFEKLARSVKARIDRLPADEQTRLAEKVRAHVEAAMTNGSGRVEERLDRFSEWFKTKASARNPTVVEFLLENPDSRNWVANRILTNPIYGARTDWAEKIFGAGLASGKMGASRRYEFVRVFSLAHWANSAKAAEMLKNATANASDELLESFLHIVADQPIWIDRHPDVVEAIFRNRQAGFRAKLEVFRWLPESTPASRKLAKVFVRESFQPKTEAEIAAIKELFTGAFQKGPGADVLEALVEESTTLRMKLFLLTDGLRNNNSQVPVKWLRKLVWDIGSAPDLEPGTLKEAVYYFEKSSWSKNPEWISICGGAPTFEKVFEIEKANRCAANLRTTSGS